MKPVENRTRPFSYRGPLLIHAGRKRAATPLGEIERRFGVDVPELELRFGGIVGIVDLVDCVIGHPSPWFEGPFGLVLHNPRPLPFVAMSGQLGLFCVPDELVPTAAIAPATRAETPRGSDSTPPPVAFY